MLRAPRQKERKHTRSRYINSRWPPNVSAARKRIREEQALLRDIQCQNWEVKSKEWVSQSNKPLAETWNDETILERSDTNIPFPNFEELAHLPQRERYCFRVLIRTAIVRSIRSTTWEDFCTRYTQEWEDPMTTTHALTPTWLGITFRFGLSQETILHSVHTGLKKRITNTWTLLLIAEFVGHSRFFCSRMRALFSFFIITVSSQPVS